MSHRHKRGRHKRRRRPPSGARPGTLVLHEGAVTPTLFVMRYDGDHFEEQALASTAEIPSFLAQPGKTWVDVQGFGDGTVLRELGQIFSIHPLALEDVAHTPQRPKTEPYEDHQLYITSMLRLDDEDHLEGEQVSVFFGADFVLTIQERPGDVLEPVRDRLRHRQGRMRSSVAGYLAYAILDAVIDGYFPIVEKLGEELEALEDLVLEDPSVEILGRLNVVKQDLIKIRRVIWPQRDAINSLLRGDSRFVPEDVRVFFRDTYDHCVQMADFVETYRELTSGLQNMYLAAVANRTNEVMKVLTIMATVFIPLTFLAGIYGMNFEYMPETKWRWAYGVFWLVTLAVGVGLFQYFKRKGWIGKGAAR